jgi:hypothetical protein
MTSHRSFALLLVLLSACCLHAAAAAASGSASSVADTHTPTTPGHPASKDAKQQPTKTHKGTVKEGASGSGEYFEDRVELPSTSAAAAAVIVAELGDPKPYLLRAEDKQHILIYCQAASPKDCDSDLLQKIEHDISRLAGKTADAVELYVPHSYALGNLLAQAQSLNFPALTIEAVGNDKIRVRKSGSPGFSDAEFQSQLQQFERDLDHLAWRAAPESPVARVFYIDAGDAARALGGDVPSANKGTGSPGGDGSSNPGNGSDSGKGTDAGQGDASSGTDATNNTPSDTGSGGGKGKPAGSKPKSPSSGKPKTKAAVPVADAAPEDNKTDTAKDDPPPATSDATPDKSKGGDGESSGAVAIHVLDPDILVFTDKTPGNDAAVAEQKRILEGIDFPRPEVIINTFSFQTSSSDANLLAQTDELLNSRIGGYNDSIQAALYRAWFYLQRRITYPDFFNPAFYHYLTRRFVAEPYTRNGVGKLTYSEDRLNQLRLCKPNTYCLGYTSLFRPLRPILTDLLFATVAAQNPGAEFRSATEQMEGFAYKDGYSEYLPAPKIKKSSKKNSGNSACAAGDFCNPATDWTSLTCDEKDIALWHAPAGLPPLPPMPATFVPNSASSVQADDALQPLDQARAAMLQGQKTIASKIAEQLSKPGSQGNPRVFPMFCFRETIEGAYPYDPTTSSYSTTNLGNPLRAALANFLFHYKMSLQYPHEFSAYDLAQSAQELNSELNPLIVAFNRDLAAALQPLEDVANSDIKGKRPRTGAGRTEFVNNGIITVRTVSGKKTTVDTVTQSFFDATNPPSITDLINSIGQAQSNVPGVLKANLSANEAAVIIGALNSVKPTTAQVGRQFSIDIMPRSLNGASSAELNVHLKTADVVDPQTYSEGKAEKDNLSRVASQTVDTKVRLESIKLFAVSSFTATLQRSRRNFPILPPLVEIPYINSFFSLPVAGAKEYHRSTAIMSAVVVPTAADLANGVAFTSDRVVISGLDVLRTPPKCATADLKESDLAGITTESVCDVRKARSLEDLRGAPIREFNKFMVRCFSEAVPETFCSGLTFGNVLPTD